MIVGSMASLSRAIRSDDCPTATTVGPRRPRHVGAEPGLRALHVREPPDWRPAAKLRRLAHAPRARGACDRCRRYRYRPLLVEGGAPRSRLLVHGGLGGRRRRTPRGRVGVLAAASPSGAGGGRPSAPSLAAAGLAWSCPSGQPRHRLGARVQRWDLPVRGSRRSPRTRCSPSRGTLASHAERADSRPRTSAGCSCWASCLPCSSTPGPRGAGLAHATSCSFPTERSSPTTSPVPASTSASAGPSRS